MENGGVRGDVRGLPESLLDYLSHYKVVGPGLDGISTCVVTFPVEMWAWWPETLDGSLAGIAAASTSAVIMYTLPADERAYVTQIWVNRTGGDNLIEKVVGLLPDAYRGSSGHPLIQFSTAPSTCFWPEPGGLQSNIDALAPGPFLMEPRSSVRLTPDGSGAAETTFEWRLALLKTKLIRAVEPT